MKILYLGKKGNDYEIDLPFFPRQLVNLLTNIKINKLPKKNKLAGLNVKYLTTDEIHKIINK